MSETMITVTIPDWFGWILVVWVIATIISNILGNIVHMLEHKIARKLAEEGVLNESYNSEDVTIFPTNSIIGDRFTSHTGRVYRFGAIDNHRMDEQQEVGWILDDE